MFSLLENTEHQAFLKINEVLWQRLVKSELDQF